MLIRGIRMRKIGAAGRLVFVRRAERQRGQDRSARARVRAVGRHPPQLRRESRQLTCRTVKTGGISLPTVLVEAVIQRAVDHGVESFVATGEVRRVGDAESHCRAGVRRPAAGLLNRCRGNCPGRSPRIHGRPGRLGCCPGRTPCRAPRRRCRRGLPVP
jgi:hypothetical protein